MIGDIVLHGLRGEHSIAALCRRKTIAESLDYSGSTAFLEAGKRRLAGDTARAAPSDELLSGVQNCPRVAEPVDAGSDFHVLFLGPAGDAARFLSRVAPVHHSLGQAPMSESDRNKNI